MNYKNKLQEFCQKDNLGFPIYTSTYTDLLWKSSVSWNELKFNSTLEHNNKRSAEQDAAKNAYVYFMTNINQCSSKINTTIDNQVDGEDLKNPYKTIILIDLENIQPDIFQISNGQLYEIHCFLSNFSTVNTQKYSNHSVHIINSGANNAADHLLTFKTGELCTHNKPENTIFNIVSRDKTSEILVKILQDKGYKVIHYTSSKSFERSFIK
jgi:hypothetical protein